MDADRIKNLVRELAEAVGEGSEPLPVGTLVVAEDEALRMETGVIVAAAVPAGVFTAEEVAASEIYLVFDTAKLGHRLSHAGYQRNYTRGGKVSGFTSGHKWYYRHELRRR